MSEALRPFHLAFPVRDLEEARIWYSSILGCTIGRESADWIDFNLYGHQIVAHLSKESSINESNEVDGHNVPVRHFGVILNPSTWENLRDDLVLKKINFIIKPNTRFKNSPGEQSTMFIKDPSGNALEFKSFKNDAMIFDK
jgi:extradiol dioxygenase family protein